MAILIEIIATDPGLLCALRYHYFNALTVNASKHSERLGEMRSGLGAYSIAWLYAQPSRISCISDATLVQILVEQLHGLISLSLPGLSVSLRRLVQAPGRFYHNNVSHVLALCLSSRTIPLDKGARRTSAVVAVKISQIHSRWNRASFLQSLVLFLFLFLLVFISLSRYSSRLLSAYRKLRAGIARCNGADHILRLRPDEAL